MDGGELSVFLEFSTRTRAGLCIDVEFEFYTFHNRV
jgi:hypothetical protein